MKQIIILFFAFISSLSAYCQVSNLEEGNQCFNKGDYICAEAKYKETFKTALGKDKQIAEIKIQRAKRCIEILKNADLAFNSKNHTKAKELYLAVLDSNPNDSHAKSQLEIINTFLSKPITTTLSLSKTDISFESSGGISSISVDTNFSPYTINLLPTWCTVQKYDKYFVINCNSYNASTLRKDYFNVIAGDKTIRVNVVQQGTASVKENYLNVSKINLNFSPESNGYENVTISTNASDFYVSLVPSWCVITKYKDYIIVSCESYIGNTSSRSDWFKISAGNKEVKVYVKQEGDIEHSVPEEIKQPKQKLSSFSSIGFQSGEIAKYGLLYERGGKRTVGFHISARTSNTSEEEILNSLGIANKTEADLGPNFELFNRFYLNVGVGFGYYDKILRNDYAGTLSLEKKGYLLATSGVMIRISRVININGGVSFMDVDKAFYKPEMSFGISFNLKNKNSY